MPTRKVNPTSAGRRGLILPDFERLQPDNAERTSFTLFKIGSWT